MIIVGLRIPVTSLVSATDVLLGNRAQISLACSFEEEHILNLRHEIKNDDVLLFPKMSAAGLIYGHSLHSDRKWSGGVVILVHVTSSKL